jgi:hypothetical protein
MSHTDHFLSNVTQLYLSVTSPTLTLTTRLKRVNDDSGNTTCSPCPSGTYTDSYG